jgi:hypothetical protein
MYYIITFLFITCSVFACSPIANSNTYKPLPQNKADSVSAININNYPALQQRMQSNSALSAYTKIVDSLVPYWQGTTWNFYGTTTQPQQGTIACGYFVTTLLQHAGIKVKRIKHAQVASAVMIKEVCKPKSVHWFSTLIDANKYLLKQANNSLFIIGLKNHTGFVAKNQQGISFINASYIQPAVVKSENFLQSPAITSSNVWVIGSL